VGKAQVLFDLVEKSSGPPTPRTIKDPAAGCGDIVQGFLHVEKDELASLLWGS